MKKQVLLPICLLMLFAGLVSANNLPPLASFSDDVNRDFFFAGETITFDGTGSYDRDEGGSSIYSYMWTIDGAYYYSSTVSLSFSLAPGQSSRTVTVKLKVRDDEHTWSSEITRIYTLRAGQDRHFYLKDYLGSVRVTVDEQGEPIGFDDYYPYGLQMPTRSSNTTNPNDRYKFTNNERDTEVGLTIDYFGARYYDPMLGSFYSIDRFSEKFPDLSPYQYAAGNPIFYLDVNGDTLKIGYKTGFWGKLGIGKTKFATYVDGQLYNQDGSTLSPNSNKFLQKAVAALGKISTGKDGAKMVSDLQNSAITFKIEKGTKNSYQIGSRTIRWDPGSTESGLNIEGGTSRPSFIGLAHELGHAHDLLDLRVDGSTWFTLSNGRDIYKAELHALHMENLVRSEHGIPLRMYYANDKGNWIGQVVDPATRLSLYPVSSVKIGQRVFPNFQQY